MSAGRLLAVVGPSGAGKDTLISAVQAQMPALYRVRRVITRAEGAGGEDFEGVSEQEFGDRVARGDFALHWQAHGLSYGIPSGLQDALADGRPVVFNGSRAMLAQAARVFPDLRVLHITADDQVLADRLRSRARETEAEIVNRLARAKLSLPPGLKVIEIDNSGALDVAVCAFTAAICQDGVLL